MFTPYKKAVIQRAQQGEICTIKEHCLHCSRNMAANRKDSNDRRGKEGISHSDDDDNDNNSSETLSEERGRDMRKKMMPATSEAFWPPSSTSEAFWPPLSTEPAMTPDETTTSTVNMIPVPTSMTPVTVPNVPGLTVSIVPGPSGAKIDIHPLNPANNSRSSEEAKDKETSSRPQLGGSLFLGHLTSYPSMHRLSALIQESIPLGPFLVHTSRSVAESTARRILLRPQQPHFTALEKRTAASQYRPNDPHPTHNNDPVAAASLLRRLLIRLDAAAANTLTRIDHIVIFLSEAGGQVRRWVVSSGSQLRDVAAYFHKTYYAEASKWAKVNDVVVLCGNVGFTVAVAAFDVAIYVLECVLDGREVREIERREGEKEGSVWFEED